MNTNEQTNLNVNKNRDRKMKLAYAHICIKTEKLDETEAFYTKVLGLEKVYNFTKNKKIFGFYLRISDMQFIEVFERYCQELWMTGLLSRG